MSVDACGPVTLADMASQVQSLRDLALRASEFEQDDFAMVCHMTADMLESNVDTMELSDAVRDH